VSLSAAVLQGAGLIRYPYTLERGVRLPDEPTPLVAGPGAHVLETREPLLINERFAERVAEVGGGGARRGHGVALTVSFADSFARVAESAV